MKLTINNQSIDFQQYENPSDKTKRNDWYGKLMIDQEMVTFEIYGVCWNCGKAIERNIDWGCVGLFFNHYIAYHSQQVDRAKKCLEYLVKEIGWWDAQDLEVGQFNLLGVTIKAMFCFDSTKQRHKFEDNEYDLYFYYEGNEQRTHMDVYGLWVVSFMGKHLLGFRRVQS